MLGGQQRQTDLARGEADVRMADFRLEGDFRWCEGVGWGDLDGEGPEAIYSFIPRGEGERC